MAGWQKILTDSNTATLTNKTFDANGTGNGISNIDIANMTAASIILESEGISSNDNDTTLATSAAIIDYVTTTVSGEDLDVTSDSGTIDIDLNSETLSIVGTANEVETSATGTTVTIGLPTNVTIGGALTVTGNLDVNGTTTSINTTNLEVSDDVIILHTGEAGAYAAAAADTAIVFSGTAAGSLLSTEIGKLTYDRTGGNRFAAGNTDIGLFKIGTANSIGTDFDTDANSLTIAAQLPALNCGGMMLDDASGAAYKATGTPVATQDGLIVWDGTDLFIYDGV